MSNFTLREPPQDSGNVNENINNLLLWCQELYDNLWIAELLLTQERKNEINSQNSDSE